MTLRMRAALEVAGVIAIGSSVPFILDNVKYAGIVLALAGLVYLSYQAFQM